MRASCGVWLPLVLTGLGFFFSPGAATAQDESLEIVAHTGVYKPNADLWAWATVDPNTGTFGVGSLTQKTGLAVGARATRWFGETLGFEADFTYAFSDVEWSSATIGNGLSFATADLNAGVWAIGTAMAFRFPLNDVVALRAKLGASLLHHFSSSDPDLNGSGLWEGIGGTTDIGAILGAGVRFGVTERLGIRFDIQDYLYSAKFEDRLGQDSDSELQNDFLFSIGLSVVR